MASQNTFAHRSSAVIRSHAASGICPEQKSSTGTVPAPVSSPRDARVDASATSKLTTRETRMGERIRLYASSRSMYL